jgi:hypothetical protein
VVAERPVVAVQPVVAVEWEDRVCRA